MSTVVKEVDSNPMFWCAPCRSYHVDPTSFAHHEALQCKAPCQFPNLAEHSPKPWRYDPETGYIVAADHSTVCGFIAPSKSLTRPANARLIVTAPHLLAALRKDVQHIAQLCDTVNTLSEKLGLGRKVRAEDFDDAARTAIAATASPDHRSLPFPSP